MHLRLILILISLAGSAFAQSNVPKANTSLRPAFEGRIFKRLHSWDHVLEFDWRQEAHDNTFKHLTLSSRYRLKNAFMLGVYGRHTWGERHNHTWMKDMSDGRWKWMDIGSNKEFNLGLMAQKKWQLSQTFFAELRVSLERHFQNNMSVAIFRPGLIWQMNHQWMTYLRYAYYEKIASIPPSIYRHAIYLGGIYSGYSPLLIGPFLRYQKQSWWTSPNFNSVTGGQYRSHDELYSIGVSVIYSL